jgi:hypothetical protein
MQGLLPLVSAAVGAFIAFAGVWLTQRRTDRRSLQERREQRLLPAYLRYHCSLREWVRIIELHARSGAITTEITEQMRAAFNEAKLSSYEIDLMAPPNIARAAERVEDQLVTLTEQLGYALRLASVETRPEVNSREALKSALANISDARMSLMVLMQQDVGLRPTDHSEIGDRDEHRLLR